MALQPQPAFATAAPAAAAVPHSGPLAGWKELLLLAAAVLAIVALKAPGALTLPQFWAEDGVVFFAQQRKYGLEALLTPYAQYLHLVPRLVAQAASGLPAAWVPAAYGWTAYLLSSLALGYFICQLQSPGTRLMAVAASALALTNGEIYGTLTNVQWFLQLYLVCACLDTRPASRRAEAVHYVLILLVALTGPFSVMMLAMLLAWAPLALLPAPWAWLRRLRAWLRQLSPWRLAALAAGAGIQLLVLLTHPHPPMHQDAANALLQVSPVVQAHTFGLAPLRLALAVPCLAGLLALLLWQFGRQGREASDRLVLGFILLMGLGQTWAGLMKIGIPLDVGGGDRYLYSFKLALWTALPLLAPSGSALRRVLLAASLVLLAWVAWKNREWLARRHLEDLHWADYAAAIDRNEAVEVPIHPRPWTLRLPARPAPGTINPRAPGQ